MPNWDLSPEWSPLPPAQAEPWLDDAALDALSLDELWDVLEELPGSDCWDGTV